MAHRPRTKPRILIVDGYNVLGALRPITPGQSIDDARDRLTEQLRDYAGYLGQPVTVVYDAWLSDRKARSVEKSGNFTLVFTQQGETADRYIERLVDELAGDIALDRVEVRVATSDLVEQVVVLGRGATRVSARELLNELESVRDTGRKAAVKPDKPARATVMERLSPATRQKLEQMRRGT